MKLDKLSNKELEDLKSNIEKQILFNLEHDINAEKTTYYMHSISCEYKWDYDSISDIKFIDAEYSIKITEEDYINDNYGEIYLDLSSDNSIHVSFYKKNKKATNKDRLELETYFYNYFQYTIFQEIDSKIENKKEYIELMLEKKKYINKEISKNCKNYLRIKKIKRLDNER